jgi:Flp pilus assembly protein CpaB
MKPKTLILMLVAVACGLAASFMTSRYLAAQHAPQDEEVAVLVPTKNLSGYTQLTDKNLFEVKQMKKSEVTKDAVADFERIKGRILKNAVAAGKPLAESDLIDISQAGITYKILPGEVAMSVKARPDTDGAGFILPGNFVDVVAYVNRSGTGEGPTAKTILQNKEVLAINHEMQAPEGAVNKQVERVTLRLKRGEEEILAVYADTGQLRLVLRREDDKKIYVTSGGKIGNLKPQIVSEDPRLPEPGPIAPPIVAPAVPDRIAEVPKAEEKDKGPHTLDIIIGNEIKRHEFPSTKDKAKDAKENEKNSGK